MGGGRTELGCSVGISMAGIFSVGISSVGIFSVGIFSVGISMVGIFSVGISSVGIFVVEESHRLQKLFDQLPTPVHLPKAASDAPARDAPAGDTPLVHALRSATRRRPLPLARWRRQHLAQMDGRGGQGRGGGGGGGGRSIGQRGVMEGEHVDDEL